MQKSQTRRWDPLVQLTHWGVAAGVVANGLFTEDGSELHQWVGYGVAALLILRWIWGLVGSPEARLTAFPPSLRRAGVHVREITRGEKTHHRSHNPLGALMVYALWGSLAVVISSGVAMSGLPGASTPVAEAASNASSPSSTMEEEGDKNEDGDAHEADEGRSEAGLIAGVDEDVMEEIHEIAANLLFVLAGLHLLGVAFETRRSGRWVLTAMLPAFLTGGRKPPRPE
ncbi:cytochrome b/b6 domain-containing protein [Phenylobacterium sp.]|uniref:cytochrome b/b6 domain-containing protein n=1 Tax=Phenylobacterium sp. TaxID=1871053 RepID=UPI0027318AFA|nr:cytochrome b/b6 domain-containing protein [Phenylobacterium sp.]MDP1873147.1 cytochrome b/b6 domain-containing protein [Phenylobacterium sp.]